MNPSPLKPIQRAIPHRPPFLLLDEIVAQDADSIRACWSPRGDDELMSRVYAGHYPKHPITPGVLLCEAIFQAGAVLLSSRVEEPASGVPVLVRIRDARFKRMVNPGEIIDISCAFEEQVSNAFYMKGDARVEGALAVRVSFTCALAAPEETA